MEQNEIAVTFTVDNSEVKLTPNIVQRFLVGNGAEVTIQEFKFFTELCKVRKLNPFLKEAYLIKYGSEPAQIVVGKDAILKRAIMNKNYDGREQGIIIQKQSGEIEYRKGTFRLPNEVLVGGWAKVYRKDISRPTEITVSFDEVAQRKKNGELNSNWANKGATMVEKVALVRALRETFVEDLGGMIDKDEAWDEGVIQQTSSDDEKEIIDLTTRCAKLKSELNGLGYDTRNEENDQYIRMSADIETQDTSHLDACGMQRLANQYKTIIEGLKGEQ